MNQQLEGDPIDPLLIGIFYIFNILSQTIKFMSHKKITDVV